MNNTDLAYIAGLIDGEGTITINRHRNKSKRGWVYQPCVSISNTVPSLCMWVQSVTGMGNVNSKDYKNRNKRYRLPWVWQVFNMEEIVVLLTKLIPFLKLKREQALLLVRFCEERIKQNRRWVPDRDRMGRFVPSTNSYTELQHQIYRRIRKLNGKGRFSEILSVR